MEDNKTVEEQPMTAKEYFEYTVQHSNIPEHSYKLEICEMMHNFFVKASAPLQSKIDRLNKEVEELKKFIDNQNDPYLR